MFFGLIGVLEIVTVYVRHIKSPYLIISAWQHTVMVLADILLSLV